MSQLEVVGCARLFLVVDDTPANLAAYFWRVLPTNQRDGYRLEFS